MRASSSGCHAERSHRVPRLQARLIPGPPQPPLCHAATHTPLWRSSCFLHPAAQKGRPSVTRATTTPGHPLLTIASPP